MRHGVGLLAHGAWTSRLTAEARAGATMQSTKPQCGCKVSMTPPFLPIRAVFPSRRADLPVAHPKP